MVALKRFRATGPSFADLVPYAGLVDNGVLLLKDGSLMAGWYFAGPDSESATDLERNDLSRQINTILSRLGSGWMIQVEAVRIPAFDYPSDDRCHFPDAVTRAIDAERRAHSRASRGISKASTRSSSPIGRLSPRRQRSANTSIRTRTAARRPMPTRSSSSSRTPFARSSSILPTPCRSGAWKHARSARGKGSGSHAMTSCCNSFASASPAKTIRSGCRMLRCISTGLRRPSSNMA